MNDKAMAQKRFFQAKQTLLMGSEQKNKRRTQAICSADDTRYRGESAQDTRRSFALDMVQGQQQSLQ